MLDEEKQFVTGTLTEVREDVFAYRVGERFNLFYVYLVDYNDHFLARTWIGNYFVLKHIDKKP